MKTIYLSGAIAILAIAAPATAHAQLLGGSGGIGGALGGRGAIGGTIGSKLGASPDSLRSTTRGAANTTTNVQGSRSVDTNTGSVATNGSVDTATSASTAQMLDTPLAGLTGNAATGSSASVNGGVNAQLVATDRIGSTLDAATATAGAAVDGTAQIVTDMAATAQFMAGSTASATGNRLAAVGSAAANAAGSIAIAPAMPVTATDGQTLGTVSQLIVDARGYVEYALVDLNGLTAQLPAGNFSAQGDALVSTMGEAEVRQLAEDQSTDMPTEPAGVQPAK